MQYASGIGPFCPNTNCDVADGPLLYQAPNPPVADYKFEEEITGEEDFPLIKPLEGEAAYNLLKEVGIFTEDGKLKPEYGGEGEIEYEDDFPVRTWEPSEVKELNQAIADVDIPDIERPGDYLIPSIPDRVIEAAPHPGKKARGASITADNASQVVGNAVNSDFGNKFPDSPTKGDVYLRTDYLPNRLFKFNGLKWIEVDKEQTDTYAYNEQYIWHLINQIDQGKYDPDILTDVERAQIAEQLEKAKNAQ
jgi:hypothetical protein